MDFNRHMLERQGLEENDIRKMEEDPRNSLLEENEREMLDFVIRAVKAPKSVTADDIQKLRDLGWEDMDMVDALTQGVSMRDHATMMEVFQMDHDCLVGERST